MKRVFVGGLEAGKNFPIRKEPFLDLTDCDDLIVVDKQYFLRNEDLIRDWALDKKLKTYIKNNWIAYYISIHIQFFTIMAVILTCPKCGHEFKSNTLNVKDPSEYQNITAMGTKEACPKCDITSTFDSTMFEWKLE